MEPTYPWRPYYDSKLLRIRGGPILRSEDEKQSDMIKKIIKKLWENFKNKRENFWMRESFSITQNWITRLNESTMYIAVFISLSTTLPEVNQRSGKEKLPLTTHNKLPIYTHPIRLIHLSTNNPTEKTMCISRA